jgi:hypothetical protein
MFDKRQQLLFLVEQWAEQYHWEMVGLNTEDGTVTLRKRDPDVIYTPVGQEPPEATN